MSQPTFQSPMLRSPGGSPRDTVAAAMIGMALGDVAVARVGVCECAAVGTASAPRGAR